MSANLSFRAWVVLAICAASSIFVDQAEAQTPVDNYVVADGRMIVAPSRDGRRLMAYAQGAGAWQTYTLAAGHKAIPVLSGDSLVALAITGKEIRTLAAFSGRRNKWVEIELRIPVKDKASPVVGDNIAFYQLGDSVYAFSSLTASWDMVSVPGGKQVGGGKDSLVWQSGDKLHVFDAQTGKWASTDLGAK